MRLTVLDQPPAAIPDLPEGTEAAQAAEDDIGAAHALSIQQTEASLPEAFAAVAAFDDLESGLAARRHRTVELWPNRALTDEEAERKHAAAVERGAKCRECPMYGSGLGPVLGEPATEPAKLMTVAEAPGEDEVLKGRPLIGWTGQQTRTALRAGGLKEAEIWFSNTILCRPPDGLAFEAHLEALKMRHKRVLKLHQQLAVSAARIGLAVESWLYADAVLSGASSGRLQLGVVSTLVTPAEACHDRLVRDIDDAAAAGAKHILTLGGQALTAVKDILDAPTAPLKKQHNAPVPLPHTPKGYEWMHVAYHPSWAGKEKKEWFGRVIQGIWRAADITTTGQRWEWLPPEQVTLEPTPIQVRDFCKAIRDKGRYGPIPATGPKLRSWVVVDLETGPKLDAEGNIVADGLDRRRNLLRRVGLGAIVNGVERVMMVPFRHMDGTPWWPAAIRDELAGYLREMFNDPNVEIVGHNAASFDASVLIHKGLLTDRSKEIWDTAVMHHDTSENDLMHDLGFCSKGPFDMILWKDDVSHKSVSNVDDATLDSYGVKDVTANMRLFEHLWDVIDREDNWSYYQTDHACGPVLREAGDLGLLIDERQRGVFSEQLNWQAQRELYKWRELAGFINPRSVQDLQELIYTDWGYKPVVQNEDSAFVIDEDEELGATSSGALIELMRSQPVTASHRQALNVLLEYRAFDKLRGAYVDGQKLAPSGLGGTAPAVNVLQWSHDFHVYEPVVTMADREAFSRLFTTYFSFVVPTGRKSTQPAIQNWPSIGRINTRAMVVAPPGHKILIADYAQLEARIFAALSGDQIILRAIHEGKDIHSMNAATLLAKNFDEIDEWYKKVEYGPNGKAKDKKYQNAEGINPDAEYRTYWRTVAKRFCIAEGELVLTDRGEVPIEEVRLTDKVWDGNNWVRHDGVVFQGYKKVISYCGLRATPDHKVWLADGRKVEFGYAAEHGLALLASSLDNKVGEVAEEFASNCKASKGEPEAVRVRVYDILNAGPRRRFVCSRWLVSNCFL